MRELSTYYPKRAFNLRPFFSYYGGKFRHAAQQYPPPVHPTIVEPFAGGAGYALRYFDRRVILCDLDPVVCAVWRYLVRASEADIRALPDLEPGQSVDDLRVAQEARWLIGFWLRRGSPRPARTGSPWMASGKWPDAFWGPRVRDRLAAQVAHIRHWTILEGNYARLPSLEAAWFIDPPYQSAGGAYRCSSRRLDYEALGAWCRSRRGQVIVCENEDATWLPFERIATTNTLRSGTGSREVVWLKGTLQAPWQDQSRRIIARWRDVSERALASGS